MAFIVGFALQFAVMYIPFVNTEIFGLVSLDLSHLLIAIGLSFCTVIIMEIVKLIIRLTKSSK